MIKDKMANFQVDARVDDYADLDMNNIMSTYEQSKDHIETLKQELNSRFDSFYDQYVRKDPARPLYNY